MLYVGFNHTQAGSPQGSPPGDSGVFICIFCEKIVQLASCKSLSRSQSSLVKKNYLQKHLDVAKQR